MVTVMTAGSIVLALAFCVRAVFGGIVQPLPDDLFFGNIEIFSLSIAIQKLVWGLAKPAFGMGISVAAFGTVLVVVGRAAPPEKAWVLSGACLCHGLRWSGCFAAAHVVACRMALGVVAAMLAPMALCIPFLRAGSRNVAEDDGTLGRTIRQAFGHASFLMLSAGLFVCGFHLAFITAHLPNFVQNFCVGTSLSPAELRSLGGKASALADFAIFLGLFPRSFTCRCVNALSWQLPPEGIRRFLPFPSVPVRGEWSPTCAGRDGPTICRRSACVGLRLQSCGWG